MTAKLHQHHVVSVCTPCQLRRVVPRILLLSCLTTWTRLATCVTGTDSTGVSLLVDTGIADGLTEATRVRLTEATRVDVWGLATRGSSVLNIINTVLDKVTRPKEMYS